MGSVSVKSRNSLYLSFLFELWWKWKYTSTNKSSTGRAKAYTLVIAHRLAKWHTHPKSNTEGILSLILVTTELFLPVIILQLSDIKETRFDHGMLLSRNTCCKWLKMFDAMPMLQTGMARKLVRDRSVKYRTRMAKELSHFLSVLSSMAIDPVKGLTANFPQLLDAGMKQGTAWWSALSWCDHRQTWKQSCCRWT